MSLASTTNNNPTKNDAAQAIKTRRASIGNEPLIFTDIYEQENNIVIWQRDLPIEIKQSVNDFLTSNPTFKTSMTVSPGSALSSLSEVFKSSEYNLIAENIAELVDMFCCLFDLSRTGLRLTALDKAMCPKFHVDRVPCRLVSTYQGSATQWLPHHCIDRSKLGHGSNGLADSESGLYQHHNDIQQLDCGHVALLKGEHWYNNENAGLVHRSPQIVDEQNRLLLTLDFAD